MGDSCMECTKWAEEIYWTHFQDLHFSQIMAAGFDRQLAIPKKFSSSLRNKLPEFVTLKGPGGGTWSVGVTTTGDTLYFKHGWQEFVNDHGLVENDLLIFKYSGKSHFEVLIFNGQNMCEKEFSYFVKRCGHKKDDHGGSLSKKKSRRTSSDKSNNGSFENLECTSVEKSRNYDGLWVQSGEPVITLTNDQVVRRRSVNRHIVSSNNDGSMVPSGEPIISPTTDEQVGLNATSARPIRTTRNHNIAFNDESSPGSGELLYVSDAEHTPTKRTGTSYGVQFLSNRRSVSEDEKNYALKLAHSEILESNSEGLIVVMKPSHVYKRFFVLLPTDWVMKYISLENQDVFLRFGEKEWRTRFNYNQLRKSAALSSGWNHFAVDNNLEEFDVCVFQPGSPVNNSFCLDVKIFRVVEEITPLTTITSPISRKNKRKLIKNEKQSIV